VLEDASGDCVRPIHTSVAGRARLAVHGLYRSPWLGTLLERGLSVLPGVRAASANILTGNVLVLFELTLPLNDIVERMVALLRGEILLFEQDPDAANVAWHTKSATETAGAFGSSMADGLSTPAAQERLAQIGANVLLPPSVRASFDILIDQFQNLPFGLLAVAAAISFVSGGALEATAILAVVALNGAIGYGVESRSEQTIRSLGQEGQRTAQVVRDGVPAELALEALVPGDLLILRRGTVVPADARIVTAHDLTLSEAMLTGESQPVTKSAVWLPDRGAPLGDRVNMVYRGTIVTGGGGAAIAVATGQRTEMGRIQRLVAAATTPETSTQRQLGEIGRYLVWFSLSVCGAVFGIGVLRGFALQQMFRSSVFLAVAAIPEGLPAVAATTLALGVEEMRRHDVVVRRLDAIETLAAVRVICFDKTGTLTLNRMTVAAVACGAGERPPRQDENLTWLLRIGVLCSETEVDSRADASLALDGSATENALVQEAIDAGLDVNALRREYPRLSIRHRTEKYRYMITTHSGARDGGRLVAVKGSPAEVLERCAWWLQDGERRELTAETRAAIERANAGMAEEALRVLGFAFRQGDWPETEAEDAAVDLTWVGLAGLADPVRPAIQELMGTLHRAGIHTLVMTGDAVLTARAVARRLGLSGDGDIGVLDAGALDRMTPDELAEAAQRAHILARVSPAQKLQTIQALQRASVVVAMIGDGINDSPALKAADVGIAMGREGADAAREMADVVLQTDDLMALVHAIERGRATYANVRRSIRYLLGTNLSEVAVVLAGTAAGFEPLSVAQLLWINLVSDVLPALGLALEPPAPGLMQAPPRPAHDPILRGQDFRDLAVEGGVIATGALVACGWGALRYGASAQTRSMTFASLVTAQLLHALTCRPRGQAGDGKPPPNWALTGILGVSFAVQLAALLAPGIRDVLGVGPMAPLDAAITLSAGTLPYMVNRMLNAGRNQRIRSDERQDDHSHETLYEPVSHGIR
jgi:Ca2+-transporting ATPase